MIRANELQGVIFDLDDTLLDNGPANKPELWLHSRSRYAAVQDVAAERGIAVLQSLTEVENGRAFMTASAHSLQGAIWNIFYMKGLAPTNEVQLSNLPLAELAADIAARKNLLHEKVLREYGTEIPGASRFIRSLAASGLAQRMALATSAIRRDIDIFLDKYELHQFFPDSRIISAEKVTRPKPDPECFELAFQSLGLPDDARRHVAAFEDNPRGLLSAKQAGLYACAITTRFSTDDPALTSVRPDIIANSYQEFSRSLDLAA